MSPRPRASGRGVRGVLFDATGTLIRPAEAIGESYARIARQHGLEISPWRLEDAFRRVHAKAPPMVFPQASAPERERRERAWWRDLVRQTFRAADSAARAGDEDALFEALWQHFARASAWRALPGARETLEALRARGVATAVVSNFDHRLPGLLSGLGLASLLDGVFLPGNTGAAKPDPGIFRAALEALGLEAAACACVGDDPERDLAPARRLGMTAIDAGRLATLADLPDRIQVTA